MENKNIKEIIITSLDEPTDDGNRSHLGFSEIGKDARLIWLKFRWSFSKLITGKQERIFSVGHSLESVIINQLKRNLNIVTEVNGKQISYSYLSGHVGGSQDGATLIDNEWYLVEIKTSCHNVFLTAKRKKLIEWNPGYYTQMQCYMASGKYNNGIFIIIDKNSGECHIEVIAQDPMILSASLDKAEAIFSHHIPESSWRSRSNYEAKFLSQIDQEIYWGDRIPKPNCRNCKHVEIINDGKKEGGWRCNMYNKNVPLSFQGVGCDRHVFFEDFIPFGRHKEYDECYDMGDVLVFNSSANLSIGANRAEVLELTSKEIHKISNNDVFLPMNKPALNNYLNGLKNIKDVFQSDIITDDKIT